MTNQFWLGPTYEFETRGWSLLAGIPAEEGRLEWLLRRTDSGEEVVSHSFVLDPDATREDLDSALADVPADVRDELVDQVLAQTEPRLIATATEEGLA